MKKSQYVIEPARKTVVEGEYDVIVVGGGVAGVSAAVAASRLGVKVAIIEKTNIFGGLATGGVILVYIPMCDGMGHQMIGGLGKELLDIAIQYGPGEIPEVWRKKHSVEKRAQERFTVIFNPASFVLGLDELVLRSKVIPFFETYVVEPVMKGKKIKGVIVQDRSGRKVLRGKTVVDASGDAVVAVATGAPVKKEKNYLVLWCLYTDIELIRKAAKENDASLAIKPLVIRPSPSGTESTERKWDGTDASQATLFNLRGRALLKEKILQMQKENGGKHLCFPVMLPSIPHFRTTCCIVGEYVLDVSDEGKTFPDSIGITGDWRYKGHRYELPYRILIPQKIDGLLTAGRIISTTTQAWEVTRVIAPCAVTGQAAGTAAAIAAISGKNPRDISIEELQKKLKNAGAKISLKESGLGKR